MTRKTQKGEYGVKLVRGPFVRLAPHAAHCETDDEFLALAEACERPLAADLFCGGGGLSFGLEKAGFDVVLGIDHDPEAVETHRASFPGMSIDWDLAEDDTIQRVARLIKRAGVTLVAGGPPASRSPGPAAPTCESRCVWGKGPGAITDATSGSRSSLSSSCQNLMRC